uniref:Uncharacterized protein n=1 Tax=Callorhinchus milii TaxID=7868 RepID=A0A4W3K8S4_CALMI
WFILPNILVFGLDGDFLRGEVTDVQADFPRVRRDLDLGQAGALLAGQRAERWDGVRSLSDVSRPGAAEGRPVHVHSRHPEMLVKEPAGIVPIPERIPAGRSQETEGDSALRHNNPGISKPRINL